MASGWQKSPRGGFSLARGSEKSKCSSSFSQTLAGRFGRFSIEAYLLGIHLFV
jgi:hypothetical protein